MRLTISALLAIALLPATARAQDASFRPRPSKLFEVRRIDPPVAADTLNLPSTYWKEGALIGGIPGLLFGGYAGQGLCGLDESSDPPNCALSALGGAVIGAVIGATTGAMIGGLFPKPTP